MFESFKIDHEYMLEGNKLIIYWVKIETFLVLIFSIHVPKTLSIFYLV